CAEPRPARDYRRQHRQAHFPARRAWPRPWSDRIPGAAWADRGQPRRPLCRRGVVDQLAANVQRPAAPGQSALAAQVPEGAIGVRGQDAPARCPLCIPDSDQIIAPRQVTLRAISDISHRSSLCEDWRLPLRPPWSSRWRSWTSLTFASSRTSVRCYQLISTVVATLTKGKRRKKRRPPYESTTQLWRYAMSIGTILIIILVIALLGGFSGLGGGPFYGTGYYGGG